MAGRGGLERGELRVAREFAIERADVGRARQIGGLERRRDPADLARSGQEHEHVSLLLAQRAQDGDGREPFGRFRLARQHGQSAAEIVGRDGKRAACCGDDGRIAKQFRDGFTVERRGHHEHTQVGPQRGA